MLPKNGVETSHIYKKDIIRTKRDGHSFAPQGFSFRKDTEATSIWPPEWKVLVQDVKLYPS